jgi:hypothetical protein
MIYPLSRLPLPSQNWVLQIVLYPNQPYLPAQSHNCSVEIFCDKLCKKQVRQKMVKVKERARREKRMGMHEDIDDAQEGYGS